MAIQKPLVIISGTIQQLPTGDSLNTGGMFSILTNAATIVQIVISGGILTILNRAGTTINVPVS